jgi:hypothetical protein
VRSTSLIQCRCVWHQTDCALTPFFIACDKKKSPA